MKKNDIGKILKVFGIIVMVLGIICSLLLGFNTVQSSPMDDIMGYMIEPTVTYDFEQVIFGIFASVVFGLILMGLSEIIYILDEKRENSRRLCMRFGINPAEINGYNGRKQGRLGHPKQNQNPNMNMGQNNGPQYSQNANGQQINQRPVTNDPMKQHEMNQHEMNQEQAAPNNQSNGSNVVNAEKTEPDAHENIVHEDYGDK